MQSSSSSGSCAVPSPGPLRTGWPLAVPRTVAWLSPTRFQQELRPRVDALPRSPLPRKVQIPRLQPICRSLLFTLVSHNWPSVIFWGCVYRMLSRALLFTVLVPFVAGAHIDRASVHRRHGKKAVAATILTKRQSYDNAKLTWYPVGLQVVSTT